ncbi:MAG: strawberry notch family protein [Phycisphaerales bacterium]|nr:strawberry notch family protein [Phycisphaerales bacterium]
MGTLVQLQFDWCARVPAAPDTAQTQGHGAPRSTDRATSAGSEAALVATGGSDTRALSIGLLARTVATILDSEPDSALDNRTLIQLADATLGSSAGHARELYDAVEAGMNVFIARAGLDLMDVTGAIDWLTSLEHRMPRQTRRDARQVELQQFSTPPAEALLVVSAAGICSGMAVLEPSAGTGNIAVLARLGGADVDTNEIDERRRMLLELQGFSPTAFDAERLDNLLPPGRFYDAVVMNPPFSSTGGRVSGHSTAFGARHVEQALLRLRPGGRLVAIVGRGMALDRPKFRAWWAEIEGRYRVRANLGIDGGVYAKFGTSFDHQIIVLDNDGATGSESDIVTGAGLSLHQAWDRLKDIAEEDVHGRLRLLNPSPGDGSDGSSLDGPADCDLPLALAGGETGRSTNRAQDSEDGKAASPGVRPLGPPGVEFIGKQERGPPLPLHVEDGSVYAAYRVQKALVNGSEPHPANVVESVAMASVEPPDPTYQLHLPADVIREGRISDIQIEDVIYAGQATESFLPDGSRRGHWNGDGTGIGKGREIYAFMYELYQRGHTKHLHVSASHQLVADAERDRSAVGLPLPIIHQARFKTADRVTAAEGVFFTTYTMLSMDFDGDRQRFKQLTEWLGPDFEGVIAFDEAHLMKNAAATPHGGKATVDEGTLRGNMGIALQRLFPRARVRYFSATGATEARHMAPYERLGLWGEGAPFPGFAAFLVAMERGGVAAMEMLCRDLKSVGTYLSRTISYGPTRRPDGSIVPDSAVEYEPLVHRMTADERRQYDQIADLWAELLTAFERGEQTACQKRNAHRYAQFYAAQQRFFLQLMLAYALPDVIPAIERDLGAGRSVVLSLFNTGEAQADRKVRDARATGVELSEFDATPREMIVQLIGTQFPIYQYREQTDPLTGNVISVRVEDSAGNPEINRENLRRQQQLLDKVADLDIPHNPLDALVSHFGVGQVAEISGRTHRWERGRYVRRKLQGVPRRQLNEYETRLFQRGQKRVAVISGAGSMGISVHADVMAKNQQRRVFYAFQLSWSADQQMQAFGRVHRSNQTSAPIIRLVLLDLAGQKRLVNAISKRLAALGALTKGERHSLSSDLFRPEDVTDEYGKGALSRLYREIELNRHDEAGIGLRDLERMGVLNKEKTAVRDNYARNVEQFLNRIMVLHVQKQNRIFELFFERYGQAVDAAKRAGAFDFGVEELRARNLRAVAESQVLYTHEATGARTLLHELEGDVDVERVPFALSLGSHADEGFFRNLRSGRVYAVAAHLETRPNEVLLTGVKGGRRSLERSELAQKYEPVERENARAWWDEAFASTPATEARRFHILSGAIFPIYDKVMGASGIQNVKIARAVLGDGRALVGLNLSPADVPNVKQRLGIGTPLAQASPTELLLLLEGGGVIELDNGWLVKRSRLAGNEIVELVLNGLAANRAELEHYGLSEEIVRFKRHWFVVVEDAESALAKLLERHQPIRDVTVGEPAGADNAAIKD